jgi:hypothetical protein
MVAGLIVRQHRPISGAEGKHLRNVIYRHVVVMADTSAFEIVRDWVRYLSRHDIRWGSTTAVLLASASAAPVSIRMNVPSNTPGDAAGASGPASDRPRYTGAESGAYTRAVNMVGFTSYIIMSSHHGY